MTAPSFDGQQVEVTDASSGSPSLARVAALGDGGFVVGMSGFAPSADDPDMGRSASFRIYGPDRAAEGPAVVVPGDLAGQDELRHLIATPDGGFAVLYVSEQLGGGGDDRTAGIRRYDATGSQIGAEATLALPEFGNVVGFSAYDDGRLAVITADFVNGDTLSVIDVTGTLILNNAETSSRISSIGPINQLVEGREGEVVLLSRSQGFSGADVRLIGFDGAGNETFDTLIFDDNQSGGVFAVARLSDGSYAVVEAASGDYTLVKVDADGVAGAPMALGTFGAAGGSLSGLAADGQGGFVVLISNFDTDAGQFKSLGVKVDASGNVEGSFPLSRDPSGGQREPAGAYIDDGDLIVSFVDSDPQTFRTTTQIQGFDPSGTTAGATPTDIVLTGAPVPIGQAGVEIGALSAVDADQTDGFVFSIVEGTAFEIEGDVLRYRAGVAGDPQFASTTEVTVRVVDNDSNIFDERFEITFEGDDGDGAGGDGGSGGGGDGSGGSDGSGGGDSSGDGGDVGGGGGGSSGGADGSGGGDGGGGGSGDSSGGGDGGGDEVGGGSGGGGGGSSGGSDGSGGNDGGGGGSDGTGSSDGIGSSDGSGSGGGGGSSDGDLGDGGDGGDEIQPVVWRGNNKNNTRSGKAGDDLLNGRGGRDRLDGKGGDDVLKGGNGNDRIKGGGGADDITGGRGRDVLTGGSGRDDFIYGRRDGRDRITDFKTGADDLEIKSGAGRFRQLEISQRGEDLRVEFARTVVVLEDVDRREFDRGDVVFT